MRKTFKYRLYPSKSQQHTLMGMLEECRWLYNYFLAERKTAWDERREQVGLYHQHNELPGLKEQRPALKAVHSQVLQNVGNRLDKAFAAFFRRAKSGEKAGYPRFRGPERYDSMTFPQPPSGCAIKNGRLYVSRVGYIKLVLHRPVDGTVKTATVKRDPTGKWHVFFSCECVDPSPLDPVEHTVGLDVGVRAFATMSTGERIENPRFMKRDARALAQVQRRMARTVWGSPARARRRKAVVRVYERVRCRRHDFAHKQSLHVVRKFQTIAVEDIKIEQLLRAGCTARRRDIGDASWRTFIAILACKAAWAGRTLVAVSPAYTSKDCSRCGYRHYTFGSADRYVCPSCGLEIDRDHNAALNILAVGLHSLGASPESPRRGESLVDDVGAVTASL